MNVTHHLVGGVVSLELLVVGVLQEDGMVADDGRHRGIIADHGLGRVLRVHLYEGLGTQEKAKRITSVNSTTSSFLDNTWRLLLPPPQPPLARANEPVVLKPLLGDPPDISQFCCSPWALNQVY